MVKYMNSVEGNFSLGRFILSFFIFLYILIYSFITLKFIFMAWQDNYSFVSSAHGIDVFGTSVEQMKLALFTIFGAVLGGATLGITSLHKYSAITKSLDIDHIWGYLMAPLLSVIIGVLIFCFLQSGLLVLTGESSKNASEISVKIGYISLGAICSYNWDVFIMKLQKMSDRLSSN